CVVCRVLNATSILAGQLEPWIDTVATNCQGGGTDSAAQSLLAGTGLQVQVGEFHLDRVAVGLLRLRGRGCELDVECRGSRGPKNTGFHTGGSGLLTCE